ncbi:MAG: oligosaccharide flippase family protein [Chloroflexi bacterium]|nr:oligosaccharide flippase family protein [Chloroflexota bacterium]
MNFLKRHLPFADRIRSDRNLKELLRNSGLMYIAGGVSIALTFLQQITTANLIGVEDYGRFAAIMASAMLVMLLVDFRTWEASAKLLARSLAEKDHDESASTVTWLSLVDLASGLAATLVLVALAAPIAHTMLRAPELTGLVRVYALLIPLRLSARGVPNTLLRLYGRFDWLSIKSIIYAVLRLVFLSGTAFLGFGLPGVIIGAVISDLLHTLMLYVMMLTLWRRNTHQTRLLRLDRPRRFREGRRLLQNLWIGASLKGLQLETFIPLLALLTSPEQVGLYRVGLDIAQLVTRLMEPFSIVIQPTLIQLYEEQPLWEFTRYIKQTTVIALSLVIPFVVGVVLLGPLIFPVVLSKDYTGVPSVAGLLAIGFGVSSIVLWLRPAIVALDAVQAQNIISFVALVCSLIGLFLAAPYGANGAALVMAAFLIGYSGASLVLFLRQIRREKMKEVTG